MNVTLKSVIIAIVSIVVLVLGFGVWKGCHDEALTDKVTEKVNTEWRNKPKQYTRDTVYIDNTQPPEHDSQPAKPVKPTGGNQAAVDSAKNHWTTLSAKDSALEFFTQPVQRTFVLHKASLTVTYYPISGNGLRMMEIDFQPEPDSVAVITTTETTINNIEPPPYQGLQWINPSLHAEVFPFTEQGLLAGLSASLCSYGTSPDANGQIFYFPTIGVATDTKKVLVLHAGVRFNFAHFLPLIQDTHLIVVITTDKKVIVGIGTSL